MPETHDRKLAVILHADVVDSTALVRLNESLAHERMQDAFRRLAEVITTHDGIAHEIRGDALVAEFSRASDAVAAAVAFQNANAAHNAGLPDQVQAAVRAGIAMGEVVVADHTLTGEGVVLAQRLEQLAEPGGTCIQGAAYETVPKRLAFEYESLGEQRLKGFEEPVRAYRVVGRDSDSEREPRSVESEGASVAGLLSLAVLPFDVIGGDRETESLADGLTEVLINTLSRARLAEVVDRSSASSLKGRKPVDVARALGVRYVILGSVQQAGNAIRVTAELFDAESGTHVWSDRFDRTVANLFELQDDIAQGISQSVRRSVIHRADWETHTDNFDAWLLSAQAVKPWMAGSARSNREARRLWEKVIAIDPGYFWGHSNAASTHLYDCIYGWSKSPTESLRQSAELTAQLLRTEAVETFPWRYYQHGSVLALQGEHERAVELAEKQLELLPDEGGVLSHIGWIHCLSGDSGRAEAILRQAIDRCEPWWTHFEWLGLAQLLNESPRQALSTLDRARTLAEDPAFPMALKAAAYAQLGEIQKADVEMRGALTNRPALTLVDFDYYLAFREEAHRERLVEALLQSGLAEH